MKHRLDCNNCSVRALLRVVSPLTVSSLPSLSPESLSLAFVFVYVLADCKQPLLLILSA